MTPAHEAILERDFQAVRRRPEADASLQGAVFHAAEEDDVAKLTKMLEEAHRRYPGEGPRAGLQAVDWVVYARVIGDKLPDKQRRTLTEPWDTFVGDTLNELD